MDLRRAAEAVGVLYAGVLFVGAMGFADRCCLVEACEIFRGGGCALVGAGLHDAGVEGAGAATEGVEGKSGGDVGGVNEGVGVVKGEAEKSEHALGAVEKRQTFFGFESDWGDGCGF